LRRFIKDSFLREQGYPVTILYRATMIFEEPADGKTITDEAAPVSPNRGGAHSNLTTSSPFPMYQSPQRSCPAAAARCGESATHNRSCGDWMAEPGQRLLR